MNPFPPFKATEAELDRYLEWTDKNYLGEQNLHLIGYQRFRSNKVDRRDGAKCDFKHKNIWRPGTITNVTEDEITIEPTHDLTEKIKLPLHTLDLTLRGEHEYCEKQYTSKIN